MINQFSRTELVIGTDALSKLQNSRVAVFGVGGVGGFTVEALARSGVGALDLIDNDTVSLTNINRQIIALHSTIGKYKVDVAAERVKDINPEAVVRTYKTFYLPETAEQFDFTQYDYIVDAIDTVTAKINLIMKAQEAGTPIICSMGTGNKIDPSQFEITDIYKTSVCPLAKVMRTELRKRGVKHLKVLFSRELPEVRAKELAYECLTERTEPGEEPKRRSVPGSVAFCPSVAGLLIAGEVIRDLTGI